MNNILKKLFLMSTLVNLLSCNLGDEYKDCGVYLEFIFDYNMEYADSFHPQVKTVDVFIFDNDGKYLFHKHATSATQLINHKRMYLSDNLASGTYQLITVGALTEHFRFTHSDGNNCIPGLTTIQDVRLSLYRQTNQISHQFPHLWFGEITTIHYQADLSVWPVHLVRNTNKFTFLLHNIDAPQVVDRQSIPPYTFEIVAPEAGVYGCDNNPLIREKITYQPYQLLPGNSPQNLSVGLINTMRLFADDTDGYQLILRNTHTSDEIWSYDLIELLEQTNKELSPNGSPIPTQEYLDRQGEWNIIIIHSGGIPGSENDFLALAIEVNGWIISLRDIEV